MKARPAVLRSIKLGLIAAGLAAFSPAVAQTAAPAPVPSQGAWLSSIKIGVADLDKAKAFYVGQLGMKVGARYGASEYGLEWPGGGAVLVLVHDAKHPVGANRGGSAIIVIVPDVAALSARLIAAGYADVGKPIVTPEMTIVFTKDPDGNIVELITLTPAV